MMVQNHRRQRNGFNRRRKKAEEHRRREQSDKDKAAAAAAKAQAKPQPRPAPPPGLAGNNKTPCFNIVMGGCANGDSCNFSYNKNDMAAAKANPDVMAKYEAFRKKKQEAKANAAKEGKGKGKEALLKEASSPEHKMSNFLLNSYFPICRIAAMKQKR